PDELAECVRTVHAGRNYVSATVGAKLAAQATQTSLTFRELDVIKLIAQGCLNKEIADRLSITEGTVKSHTSALFQKLGAANRTEGVREAVRRGLVRLGVGRAVQAESSSPIVSRADSTIPWPHKTSRSVGMPL